MRRWAFCCRGASRSYCADVIAAGAARGWRRAHLLATGNLRRALQRLLAAPPFFPATRFSVRTSAPPLENFPGASGFRCSCCSSFARVEAIHPNLPVRRALRTARPALLAPGGCGRMAEQRSSRCDGQLSAGRCRAGGLHPRCRSWIPAVRNHRRRPRNRTGRPFILSRRFGSSAGSTSVKPPLTPEK